MRLIAAVAAMMLSACGSGETFEGSCSDDTDHECQEFYTSGAIDSQWVQSLQDSCPGYWYSSPCPTAGRVQGHCENRAVEGSLSIFYYYSAAAVAQGKASCLAGLAETWKP